ncbi:MAG: hypothetical protein WC637_20925 [Victivallales bacterium]|jgi:Holliday junction resolvasome RuvABC endonuclease subunit
MTNILALDTGLHCGWAASLGEPRVQTHGLTREITVIHPTVFSGVWNLKPKAREGYGRRFVKFRKHLVETLVLLEIGKVVYERVRRHMGTDAAHSFGGFIAHLTEICEEHGIPYEGFEVGTIKKVVTGYGGADKKLMIKVAKILYPGIEPQDDNEADALGILYTAEYGG